MSFNFRTHECGDWLFVDDTQVSVDRDMTRGGGLLDCFVLFFDCLLAQVNTLRVWLSKWTMVQFFDSQFDTIEKDEP